MTSAQMYDPLKVPLALQKVPGRENQYEIRPLGSAFPDTKLVYEHDGSGRPIICEIAVDAGHRRERLGTRMVEEFVAEHGPGEHQSTQPVDDDARSFWRSMESKVGIVVVDEKGHRRY